MRLKRIVLRECVFTPLPTPDEIYINDVNDVINEYPPSDIFTNYCAKSNLGLR